MWSAIGVQQRQFLVSEIVIWICMQSLTIHFSKRLLRSQRFQFSSTGKPVSNTCNEVVSKTIPENYTLSEPSSPINKSSVVEEKNSIPLPILKHTVDYPWLMSYQQPRIPAPSFLTSFKNKQLLKAGTFFHLSHMKKRFKKSSETSSRACLPFSRGLLRRCEDVYSKPVQITFYSIDSHIEGRKSSHDTVRVWLYSTGPQWTHQKRR